MTRDNKSMKLGRQRGRDANSALPAQPKHNINDGFTQHGPQCSPAPNWARTCERAAITHRSKRIKVTLAPLPWKEDA